MKKLFTLIALLTCIVGAKAVEIVDAEVDFSKYTDISEVPFASWGGNASAFERLSIKDGCLHFESSVAVDPSWDCQFLPIGGVKVELGITYTLHFKIKGDHAGNVSMLGFGQTPYGMFPITTEWVEGTVDYLATSTEGDIRIQCGDWIGSFDIAYLRITHEGKPEKPIEWVEMLTNGDAETPWANPNLPFYDMENNYKICAWAKEKGENMDPDGLSNPFPATIEPEEGNPSNHVFVVHGKEATTEGDASAWDNRFWIQSPKAWKAGSQVKVSFRYKASKAVTVRTACDHQTPTDYLIWHAIGYISFTEEWQTYDDIMTIADDMDGTWSICFYLNEDDKDAIDFYFDDLSWQGMKLDEGLFVAAANPGTGIEYDFDNATELVYDEGLEAYVGTVGTVGNPDSWVNQVMVSTFRGNDKAFKGATIRPAGIIDGSDEAWLNYTESPNAVINLPAAGVWQIAVDIVCEQMNFYLIEGDEIKKPLEEIPNPTEVVVHGLERDAITGQLWDNAFYIVSNRPLTTGEGTILKFKYKATVDAHTTTQLHGTPGAYMHYKAIGDVDFTTEWQDFYTTLIVPAEADGMKSIGFYMAEIKDACDYYIKDVIWMTEDHTETLINTEGAENFYVKEGAGSIARMFGTNIYTVAGSFNDGAAGEDDPIFGKKWNPLANIMQQGEDGIYKLTIPNVSLTAGTIYYKVVRNQNWLFGDWGFNGNNADYVVKEDGTYDITFYFNPDALLENNFNVHCVLTEGSTEKTVYTEFVEETGTLTYYYDGLRETRSGVTELYDPVGNPDAVRFADYHYNVTKTVIDPSMKDAELTSMRKMFYGGYNPETSEMYTLDYMTSIEGLENLNTSIVTDMSLMFNGCQSLTSLDLNSFNISNVTTMRDMFSGCLILTTIYCQDDWSTSTAISDNMFMGCDNLVGGKGTTFDSNVVDATYARPDGGTESPGYFTASVTGDLNGDEKVDIADAVTVLNIMAAGEYVSAADLNQDSKIDIADFVTVLNIMAAQ